MNFFYLKKYIYISTFKSLKQEIMKQKSVVLLVFILITTWFSIDLFAQKNDSLIIQGEICYDDRFSFEEFPLITNRITVQNAESVLSRFFCRTPDKRSPLETINNYEKTIAKYLNVNKTQKFLIVGNTDDFDMNISLSKDRADA